MFFFPFEQLIGQQMVRFQIFILKHLHHHTLFCMLFDKIFEAHYACILSCSGLKVLIWFIIWLVFLAFWLSSPIFAQHFVHDLDYSILLLQVSFDVCAYILLTLWVSTSYIVLMAINPWEPMMQFETPLLPLCEMLASMWDKNNYICFSTTFNSSCQ
jgi:hypothetical protein